MLPQIPELTSSFAFRIHDGRRLRVIGKLRSFALLSILCGPPAMAAPWSIDPALLSHRTQEKLQKQFPDIRNADDLESLLRAVSRSNPVRNLQAEWSQGQWQLIGTKVPLISDIRFDLTTRVFRRELESVTQPFLRQISTPEIHQRIHESIAAFLSKKGFQKARVEVSSTAKGGQSSLTILVREGYPCLIEAISYAFTPPPGIDFRVEPGAICDQGEVDAAMSDLEAQLKKQGFNQLRLGPVRWSYDEKLNASRLYIAGDLGQKIRYELRTVDRKYYLGDIFQADELNTLDPSTVSPDAVRAELVRRYRNRGFIDAEVSGPETKQQASNEVVHTYTITTGTRYELASIQFEGATILSTSELLDIMELSSLWQTSTPLNLEDIERGIESVTAVYNQRGYWDVKIREPRIALNRESGRAQMVISIDEGLPRIFQNIEISGASAIKPDTIKALFVPKPGEAFERGALLDFERAIRASYVEKGYLYIEAAIQLKAEQQKSLVDVSVVVSIDEGIRVKFGEVSIVGLNRTQLEVVTREVSIKEGDWYNPETIDESRRALIALGLFRTVQIQPADKNALATKQDVVDLQIEVREGEPGVITFGPGWSLYRGLRFGIETSYNNIGGYGRQVFARAKLSEDKNQQAIDTRKNKTLIGRGISVGYLEPYLMGLPVNGKISAAHNAKADETWVITREFELALSHRLRQFQSVSSVTGFYNQRIDEEFGSDAQRQADIIDSRVRVGTIGLRLLIDFRNDVTWPTSGSVLGGEVSWARPPFFSDLSFNHWEVDYSHYFEILENWVVATGVSYSAFLNVQRDGSLPDRLPRTERLQLDGAKIVRGFEERTLGPRFRFTNVDENGDVTSTNEVAGGTHRALYRLEVRRQLVANTFAISAFVDSGTTFFNVSEVPEYQSNTSAIVDNNPYAFEDILLNPALIWQKNYVSYGLSANFLTPVGSINLAYGLPWKPCASPANDCAYPGGDAGGPIYKRGQFHMNVGATF